MQLDHLNIEHDIIKMYRKDIWSRFVKGLKTFKMIDDNDKIAVAISGGKDSFLMAKLFQELTKHPMVDFEVVFVMMDPGYSKENLHKIQKTSERLGIPLNIEPYHVFKVINNIAKDDPCYLCARMRRGFLYSVAEKYGCNKLALGHHYDDVIETTLLNLFYTGSFKTMLPKIKSRNFEGITLIRPMYFIKEKSIIKIMEKNNVDAIDCGCAVAAKEVESKRAEIKTLIETLKTINPEIDKSIFRAAANVHLDHIISWKKSGIRYHFDE